MLDYAYSNPWRKPNWRWGRALGIVEGMQPGTTRRRDGELGYYWIKKAVKYLTAANAAQDEFTKMSLALDEPAMFWSRWAFEQEKHPAKWIMEARIMARASSQNIAYHANCGQEIVDTYEALFFDVRDKLDRRDYVNSAIFGDDVQTGIQERKYGILWKILGYAGGPHVLDAAMSKLTSPSWVNQPAHVSNFFQDVALTTMKKKAAIATMTVSVNANTQLDLLATFVKFVEIERTTESQGKVQDQIMEDLTSVLKALPWKRAGVAGPPPGPSYDYDMSSVELTCDQLLLLGSGQPLENGAELLQLGFPEHTKPELEEKPTQ